MDVKFKPEAVNDIEYWKHSGNKGIQSKIDKLLKSIRETPYAGIGKPKILKYNLSGYYSRRINAEHRIVYAVDLETDIITIHSARWHYDK